MPEDVKGYLSLLLHAHLPYVRHPEHERFLEESWFFEAMTETYLPLLWVLEGMARDGVDFRMSWSLTPTLVSMFQDELLNERYERHLRGLVDLAEKEVIRQHFHPSFRGTAEFYRERYGLLLDYYTGTCGRDLTAAFRRLQDRGLVEILCSAATHAYLPLLRHEPSSVRAQVLVAIDHYRESFGSDPQGFWLPECAYYPGLDEVLAGAGIRYFSLESHGVLHGSTRAKYGVHAPIVCPSGVAAFARDPECSRQVWSAEVGFPGDPDYREFYWDIGYHLPMEYVEPYIGPDGVRTQTGIKYHRITGPTENKEPYVRERALEKAALHAGQFLEWRRAQIEWLASRMDQKPIILAPYDAELFGHWWFEGPEWIHFLLRQAASEPGAVRTATPSEYLAEFPQAQESVPASSSWGRGGQSEVWLNGTNDWIYPRLHAAARRMEELATLHAAGDGLARRALEQAGRELLLAEASDWAFILETRTATGYAQSRIEEHLENFEKISTMLEGSTFDEEVLRRLEAKNAIFPRLDPAVFAGEIPRPVWAVPREPEHVVFLTAELSPLVKVGGLADVAGSLPAALAANGLKVTVVLPAYRQIDRGLFGIRPLLPARRIWFGSRRVSFELLEAVPPAPGVRLLLVDCPEYFDRDGVYVDPATRKEYADTGERFAFFTRAALEALRALGDPVDVVHSHDHQTGLAAAFLKIHHARDPVLGRAACVYTLHNVGYQGVYGPEFLETIGIGRDQFYPGSHFEYYGMVNCMKIGIALADKISTVSPTYAREICHDGAQGASLEGVLSSRKSDLVGILNGIDVEEWDPARDPLIASCFDAEHLEGKLRSKRALLEEVGLDPRRVDAPLIGMITRLVDQKGLDLVVEALEEILDTGASLVVLGTGLPKYEKFLEEARRKHRGRVAALLRFDNGLAHRIEAASDIFLMPSLYEPCGLNQMYSLRYGAIPVVRETGGLADTVPDIDANGNGVGFTFREYSAGAMLVAIERAVEMFGDSSRWKDLVGRAMRRNFSWDLSAARYIELYRDALRDMKSLAPRRRGAAPAGIGVAEEGASR